METVEGSRDAESGTEGAEDGVGAVDGPSQSFVVGEGALDYGDGGGGANAWRQFGWVPSEDG